MLSIKQLKRMAIVMVAVLTACTSEVISDLSDVSEEPSVPVFQEKELRQFSSPEEVVSAMDNYSIKTRSDDGFVSYLETVMEEPGYDDQPYAILSDAFGSLLNPNGELVFDNNLLHVSRYGILYGPYEKSDMIRNLSENEKLPSLCKSRGLYETLSNDKFYKVDGYEGIYLYDTFGVIDEENVSGIFTRSNDGPYTGGLQRIAITSTSEEVVFRWKQDNGLWRENWSAKFTIPESGHQKQKFSSGKHCNDTKIYHQDYGIATDTGLKTKTMKKRALGYWDKIKGDMEAGIIELSVFESLPSSLTASQGDICTIKFGNKSYTVKNYGVGNHNLAYYQQTLTWATVEKAVAEYNVDAVRYIDYLTKQAITFFPNLFVKKNTNKIEMNFRVPFGGYSQGPGYSDAKFYVIHQKIFGLTVRDNEIRGTEINYNY